MKKNASEKVKVTIYLTPDLYDTLQQIAETQERSTTYIVEKIIVAAIKGKIPSFLLQQESKPDDQR